MKKIYLTILFFILASPGSLCQQEVNMNLRNFQKGEAWMLYGNSQEHLFVEVSFTCTDTVNYPVLIDQRTFNMNCREYKKRNTRRVNKLISNKKGLARTLKVARRCYIVIEDESGNMSLYYYCGAKQNDGVLCRESAVWKDIAHNTQEDSILHDKGLTSLPINNLKVTNKSRYFRMHYIFKPTKRLVWNYIASLKYSFPLSFGYINPYKKRKIDKVFFGIESKTLRKEFKREYQQYTKLVISSNWINLKEIQSLLD